MSVLIEEMRDSDWEDVRSIYAEGIATGNATLDTETPDWDAWNRSHLPSCRVVARDGDSVVGWGALCPVSERCVYYGVAEVSVYIAAAERGKRIGKGILKKLIELSEAAGIWTLQAGMFPENLASVALHKSCGFREVGTRERVGELKGVWRDVVLMERRSTIVGVPE